MLTRHANTVRPLLIPLPLLLPLALLASCAPAPCPIAPATAAPSTAQAAPPPPAAPTPAAAQKIDDDFPVDRVRGALLAAMNAKDVKRIDAMFSANMRAALPPEKVAGFVDKILTAKGALRGATLMTDQPTSPRNATFRIQAERGEWRLTLTVADDDTVLGMKLTDPPPSDPDVRRSTLPLALPFTGEWTVFWGGATEDVNQHVRHKSQRRAADLLVLDAAGKSHTGEGKANADYYAYGRDVIAAADGKVITVVDGVPDSAPGVLNPYAAIGNAVVIEHTQPAAEKAVYSLYAHLQPGSLRVKPGNKVTRGQPLGRCGNSGNSTEPHLHFQLMDGPRVESSYGVEPVFPKADVERGGKRETVTSYTFLKGDRVRAPTGAAALR